MSKLTAKQKVFIEELPKNQWNGTQAAFAAGYSPKSAGVIAHRLLKNPVIAEELDRRTAEIIEKTDVEVGEIIAALRGIAFGKKKATVSEQLKALQLLGKYRRMFSGRQIFEDPMNEHPKLSKEELEAAREQGMKLIKSMGRAGQEA